MGLRPLFEDLCRRLATHGLSVCAFEPFAHIPDHERAQLDVTARMARARELHDDWDPRVGKRRRRPRRARRANGNDLGDRLLHGGYFCFKAAASTRFANAVPFYGMVRTPAAWRGEYLQEPLDTIRDSCPTLAIFGGKDSYTPPEDIAALREAFGGLPATRSWSIPTPSTAFVHDPSRPSHRADDAATRGVARSRSAASGSAAPAADGCGRRTGAAGVGDRSSRRLRRDAEAVGDGSSRRLLQAMRRRRRPIVERLRRDASCRRRLVAPARHSACRAAIRSQPRTSYNY